MTPNAKNQNIGMSSTKMTKAERLNELKQSNVIVSDFCIDTSARKDTVILADILNEE
jgi:hypothetical protein